MTKSTKLDSLAAAAIDPRISVEDLLDPEMGLLDEEERTALVAAIDDPWRYPSVALAEVIATWDMPSARGGGKFPNLHHSIKRYRTARKISTRVR